jgi:hypothetical protein
MQIFFVADMWSLYLYQFIPSLQSSIPTFRFQRRREGLALLIGLSGLSIISYKTGGLPHVDYWGRDISRLPTKLLVDAKV